MLSSRPELSEASAVEGPAVPANSTCAAYFFWDSTLVVLVIRRQSCHSRFNSVRATTLAVTVKIPDQFLILVPHILRPDDVGGINVRPVVNPFVNRIVAGTVANDDEMLAACMPEAVQDFGTLPMPGISVGIPRYSEIFGADAGDTHCQTQDANDRDECSSQVTAGSAATAEGGAVPESRWHK